MTAHPWLTLALATLAWNATILALVALVATRRALRQAHQHHPDSAKR